MTRYISPGLALILGLTTAAVAQVPTPESVLGYKPGADFHLATYDDALGYFRKVAAASNRITSTGCVLEARSKPHP